MIYLDNAATTIPDIQVVEEIQRVLMDCYANPSALYSEGMKSASLLEKAREQLAVELGCSAKEVYFTASGTEANNMAVLGTARVRKHFGNEIITTGFEHPSVLNAVDALRKEGFRVHTVKPDSGGTVDPLRILELVNERTVLVAVMHINNETGSVTDVPALAGKVKQINRRTAFHSDMIQSFMKYPVSLMKTEIDTASVSAHKIHGPKGIGALYVRRGLNIEPVVYGGNQERGLRSGTENVAYASAFALAALRFDTNANLHKAAVLNDSLREALKGIDGVIVNSPDDASKYILNFSVLNYRSETVIHLLDGRGIMISAGAACSKGSASHTLTAMGLDRRTVESSLRVSFSKDNTIKEVDALIQAVRSVKDSIISY